MKNGRRAAPELRPETPEQRAERRGGERESERERERERKRREREREREPRGMGIGMTLRQAGTSGLGLYKY